MLLAPRSWPYSLMHRRLYTTSKTHPRPELARVHGKRFAVPMISTLCPEKFEHSDFLVLAGRLRLSFHTPLSLRSPKRHADQTQVTKIRYQSRSVDRPDGAEHDVKPRDDGATTAASDVLKKGKRRPLGVPFPEHAQGFLYLHQPQLESGLPRSASSVRFRCVPSLAELASLEPVKTSTPRSGPLVLLPPSVTNQKIYEAFKTGYDLTRPNGTPWSIPVIVIAGRHSLRYIRMQLLEDKFFSGKELREYASIYKNTKPQQGSSLLHTMNDVFPVRFDAASFPVWPMTMEVEENASQTIWERRTYFRGVFMDTRIKYNRKLPYIGTAHARFELAPGSSLSKPALSLRIIEITKPVQCVIPDYDGYICVPKEGELVARGKPGTPKPWSFPLSPPETRNSAMLSLVPDYAANATSC